MKSILLHVQDDERVDVRVENALAIARAADAHLDVLHITPESAEAVFESFGGIDVDGNGLANLRKAEDALEQRVRAELENEDVSWDYVRRTGSVVGTLTAGAALADLIVTGRATHTSAGGKPHVLLGDLLFSSRTPVFVRGDRQERFDPKGKAIIAWDGSYEAANAVRDGLGLLRLASDVEVVRVTEHGEEVQPGLYPVTRVLEYLSRNDVHANYSRIAEIEGRVSTALLDHADKMGAGLIVMGGFSPNARSRLNALLFTGMFIGMSGGALLGSLALAQWGWPAVMVIGVLSSAAAAVWRWRG